jgi:hypothetical protein
VTTPSLNPAQPVRDPELVQLPRERRITMFALACLVFLPPAAGRLVLRR